MNFFGFYKSVLIGMPIFLFNGYCGFSGCLMHSNLLLLFIQFIFISTNLMLYVIYD